MNRFLAIFFICAVAAMSACVVEETHPNDTTPPEETVSGIITVPLVGGDSLAVYADEPEDAATLEFEVSEKWTISVEDQTRAGDVWVHFYISGSPVVGGSAGEQKVTIRLDENTSGVTRTATVLIRSGENVKEITITQDSRTIEEARGDGDYAPRPGEYDALTITTPVGGGSYSVKLGRGDEGEDVVYLEALPENLYVFNGWRVIAGGINVRNTATTQFVMPVGGGVELELYFIPFIGTTHPIEVEVDDPAMGTAKADASDATQGATVTLVAAPNDGYVFVKWEVIAPEGLVLVGSSFKMPAEEVRVRAVFAKLYHVTATSADEATGTVKVMPASATEGQVVTLAAAPREGYKFDKWVVVSGGVTVSAENTFIMPASDVEVRAQFTQENSTVFNGFTKIADPVLAQYCRQFDTDKDNILSQAECEAARVLAVEANALTSAAGIELFTELTKLQIRSNGLTVLDVSKNTKLVDLDCIGSKQLTVLDLSHNPELEFLNCMSTSITALDLSHNPKLRTVLCGYTSTLASLDLSNNPELISLLCDNSLLTELDLSHAPKLGQLHCVSNRLTALDVSHNPGLTELNCNDNYLTTLDVSANTKLESLQCSSNLLSELDLSHNPELAVLFCWGNELTSLDVSGNGALTNLRCNSNPTMTTLVLPDEGRIKHLECHQTNLSSLDVSQQSGLDFLRCYESNLTELDITSNSKLKELTCGNQKAGNLTLTMSSGQSAMWERMLTEFSRDNSNVDAVVTTP